MHLEGLQSVGSAIQARKRKIEVLLLKSGMNLKRIAGLLEQAESQNIPIKYVEPTELSQITHGRTHGGVVALCSRKPLERFQDLREILRARSGYPLLLLLEGVEDGQHLGYVLRSAEALGAHAVLLKKHLWSFDETTLSRASSGAFERVPVIKFSEADEVRHFVKYDIELWGCIAGVKKDMYSVNMKKPLALAVGGEKRGLSGKVRERCDGFMKIPMVEGSSSSLSLTHAACLLLGEAARQRRIVK